MREMKEMNGRGKLEKGLFFVGLDNGLSEDGLESRGDILAAASRLGVVWNEFLARHYKNRMRNWVGD